MKAITLHQPYASLIAAGLKRYETRSFKTNHRGLIAIHAGQQRQLLTREQKVILYLPEYKDDEELKKIRYGQYPLGAIVAVVEIKDCILMDEDFMGLQTPVELACGDWKVGRYAWELTNIRPVIKPYYVKGQQGIWFVTDEIEQIVEGVEAI